MTISNEVVKVSYTGTGAETALSTTFPFFDDSDLVVTKRVTATGAETVLTLDTHYTVSGGDGDVGTVTPIDGATDFPSTVTWTISRDIPKTQAADYITGGDFDAESHETALDKLTLLVQDVGERILRSVKFPVSDSESLSAEVPNSVDRASKYLGFDSNGEFVSLDAPADTTALSTFGASLVLAANAAAARILLDALQDVFTTRGDLLVEGASGEQRLALGSAGQVVASDGTDVTWADVVIKGYFEGFTLSNGTDPDVDLDVSDGICADSSNTVMIGLSALTKKIDATWAEGDGEGGMNDSESVGNDTWYHVFAIWDPTGRTGDVGFDTDIDAAQLMADAAVVAAGYTKHQYIGSVLTDGTGDIIKFIHDGDHWYWNDPDEVGFYHADNPATANQIDATVAIPPDIKVLGNFNFLIEPGASTKVYIHQPDVTDDFPSVSTSPFAAFYADVTIAVTAQCIWVRSNTSSQIAYRIDTTHANTDVEITTLGWIYKRGSYR